MATLAPSFSLLEQWHPKIQGEAGSGGCTREAPAQSKEGSRFFERAMAHAGKDELLLGGGVACNERLRNMCQIMATSRDSTSHVPEKFLCIDNGSMIATLGRLQLLWGSETALDESGVRQDLRTDETPILWN